MFVINRQRLIILLTLSLIFTFGVFLRYKNIAGYNIVFDYDQIEDQLYTYTIALDRNLAIIGRAVYGDPHLHHGVFYYYYNLIPFLLSSGNFLISVYWNIFFNASSALILFIFAKLIFKKSLPALLAAIIAASSFEFIKFSNWLTIDTVAIILVPLFFLGLWNYYEHKKWGLILSAVTGGLSIQTDLSFLYLILILIIYWFVFRPKIPDLKLLLLSALSFLVVISTLILTEIKLNFAGVKTLLNFSNISEATSLSYTERLHLFFEDFLTNFTNNLFPQKPELGIFLAGAVILTLAYFLFSNKTPRQEKKGIYFLLIYLFAPATTLLIGYHDKPWFLIGLPPAIALISGYAISKLNNLYLIIPIIFLIIGSNTNIILQRPNEAYKLFDNIYDSTSYLKYQLQVVDYTYLASGGQPFAINAVTYPLYYNGMWAYLYSWYGKSRYQYLPGWLGGDQLHPYDLLPKVNEEKIFYMIISETARIPDIYKNQGKFWALKRGKLIEEKIFTGFTVLKMEK
ncbi:hypothetical protein HYZ05_03315 [Candidatus Daviesbacteria bacterium]|nr:hypothetical protein [Candidatus Daviesbacteria bacterium]